MKTVQALLALGVLSLSMVCAAAPEAAGVVRVGEESGKWLGAGFVADDKGHVIAYIKSRWERRSDKPLLVKTLEGGEYKASRVTLYKDISLLKITGDVTALKPYIVAHSPAESQRRVSGVKVDEDLSQSEVVAGTLASLEQPQTGPGYYLHNAMIGDWGIGGPLLNNCGDVVGIIVPESLIKQWVRRIVGGSSYAVPIGVINEEFRLHGLLSSQSESPCLSEAEQAAARQARLEELEDAAVAAEAALAELESQLGQEQEAGEEERQLLEEKVAAHQAKLYAVEEERQRLEEEIEAERRASEERTEQYNLWGILGTGALLLLLLLVWAIKQRAVTRAHREEAAARARADAAQADKERIHRTPTVFLEGAGTTGKTIALRIPGASIASDGGAVVGRNPADSDFVINHPEVSRRQFRLFSDGDLLMIEDLGSTNGTRVDGKNLARGQEHPLADRNRVALGQLNLSVRLESND